MTIDKYKPHPGTRRRRVFQTTIIGRSKDCAFHRLAFLHVFETYFGKTMNGGEDDNARHKREEEERRAKRKVREGKL